MATVPEAKALVAELCREFYRQGWVSGTGGGMSVKVADQIVMAPSGVQKERMTPEDMFVLDARGQVVAAPAARPPPAKPPKLSECAPLFMSAYDLRSAGAVMHSHSLNAMLATLIDQTATEFSVTNLEMIKGIAGHGYYENCVVPIIENTARECELTDRLQEAIKAYPNTSAVLVRRHGVYVWGRDWVQAKTQAECYDYLFEAAVRMSQMGIKASQAPAGLHAPQANGAANGIAHNGAGQKKQKAVKRDQPLAIVLDIEGTIAPITYVTDTLFPYAAQHMKEHLAATYHTKSTQADIALLRQQAAVDGASAGLQIPEAAAGQAAVEEAVVEYVRHQMAQDRKSTALKSFQGHIWEKGFAEGALTAALFQDVPPALQRWKEAGIRTYIYSSGSRRAQANLLGHTMDGDLRPLISGYFDTTSGPKTAAESYEGLQLALGLDYPEQALFVTDSMSEADAARSACWLVVLAVRPGNAPLPEHTTPVITNFEELDAQW